MNGFARQYGGIDLRPILVTPFGDIRISYETAIVLDADVPGWSHIRDRRTKAYRRLCEIERDINALAEAMWLTGDDLTEI